MNHDLDIPSKRFLASFKHPKLNRLCEVILGYESLMTAYSGGIDSTLVAVVSRVLLGKEAGVAVIGVSLSLAQREYQQAIEVARDFDIRVIEVKPSEQEDRDYLKNDGNRCFYCKTHLYTSLKAEAKRLGLRVIANGSNLDDLGDYRPGLRAAEDFEVVSPLIEAGFTKADVREVAGLMGIANWAKPASPCLASRIAYGLEVTPERLRQVERAEDYLLGLGIEVCRVRHHGDLARIEVGLEDISNVISEKNRNNILCTMKNIGFQFVSLDIEGFRSGSGNVVLGERLRDSTR